MPAVFNFKICDNAPECNGPGACPTGALAWDEKEKRLFIDNSKCTGCGACANACPVKGAILVAQTQEELKDLKKKIEDDPRTLWEFLQERYGASPTDPSIIVNKINFDEEITKSDKVVLVDFWAPNFVACRVKSIIFKDVMPKETVLRKINAEVNTDLAEKYNVKTFPSLLIFKNGEEIGRIEGRLLIDEIDKFKSEIDQIIKKLA